MKALLFEPLEDNAVSCRLCHHYCTIRDGRRGLCNVRENRGGELHTLVHDHIAACHVDPIEKKPLFHFYPGSLAYSLGTVGCNFRCRFCQNADIAQMPTDHDGRIVGRRIMPMEIVEDAIQSGCKSIAYTYTEPTVFFELALETAKIAHAKGLKNIFVTNGYLSAEALDLIHPVLDAANVDLKGFSEAFYKHQCGARLKPVLGTLKKMKALGVFVEVTTLVIPGLNDDAGELRDLARFIASDLGVDTPWHVSRFHPTYRLTDRPPTPVKTLLTSREIGLAAGLRHVYTGNVPGLDAEHTFCHGCGEVLISRMGFTVMENRTRNGRCPFCDAVITGAGL